MVKQQNVLLIIFGMNWNIHINTFFENKNLQDLLKQ